MNAIQFIQTTPDQLQNAIIAGVRMEINELKKEFAHTTPQIFYPPRSKGTVKS
jgi:hypothetical protein